MLEMTMKELFQGEGLHLDVMDFDTVGKNERLGYTQIGPREMFTCNGTRTKLPLEGVNAKGMLSIRVRIATPSDINFMKEFEMANKKKPYAASDAAMMIAQSKKGGVNSIQSVLSRNVKTEKVGSGHYIKKVSCENVRRPSSRLRIRSNNTIQYRVRPGPDPKRVEQTTWMTSEEMEKEVYEESREWIDAGSGTLGRLFVEILSCNGLPNLDTGGFTGNYTDAFACLVFEDVWGQTDIIDDDLNPKWMPWTKRAFIFHMYHSSSQLFIGVFDNDAVDDHDLIGRIAVNISNLQPDTLYTLTYDLYPSGKWSIRDPRGQITIRLRFEIDDDRKLLLSALEPPKTIYVNVMDKKNFNVLQGACNGAYDMDAYSLKTLYA
jgi:C2 domain